MDRKRTASDDAIMPRHLKLARIAKIFGEQLRRRRLAKGLTQEEFAHRCSLDISFVSRVERGISQPSVGVLIQMAKSLDSTAAELMEDLELALGGK